MDTQSSKSLTYAADLKNFKNRKTFNVFLSSLAKNNDTYAKSKYDDQQVSLTKKQSSALLLVYSAVLRNSNNTYKIYLKK